MDFGNAPFKKRKLEEHKRALPIHDRRGEIIRSVLTSQVVIVQGDTGCGKTTQVPQFLIQTGTAQRIAVAQPRRIAAVGVATQVARELNSKLGDIVGYHIKGESVYSKDSKIVFMTTGMLIQELVGSQEIKWSHVIVDEVHERSVETEFLLVILKHMLLNNQAKLILMSATIEASIFANYFADSEIKRVFESGWNKKNSDETWGSKTQSQPKIAETSESYCSVIEDPAPIIQAGAKNFPVKDYFLQEILNLISESFTLTAIETDELAIYYREDLVGIQPSLYKIAGYIVKSQHLIKKFSQEAEPQTFLIFLPGIHEINKMADTLEQEIMPEYSEEIEICRLHSSIPEETHTAIFNKPQGKRRVIISTNIAESSITLPDVKYIIDFGLTKEIKYNSRTMSEILQMEWASKAVLEQRKGRAGRVSDGVCFKLIPTGFYKELPNFSTPEIQRCPLERLVLKVKQLNLGEPHAVLGRAIQPPSIEDIKLATQYLTQMGALTLEGNLTWLGRVYADMPCQIKISRICLFGYVFGVLEDSLIIAACISQDKPIFVSGANSSFKFAQRESERYASKLQFDNLVCSDPITFMRGYKFWYQEWGQAFKSNFDLKSNIKKPKVSREERIWCMNYYLDPNILREVFVTFTELKRRMLMLGISKEHLRVKSTSEGNHLMTLKVVLAAAFSGKYLISHYSIQDEVSRRRMQQIMGPECVRTVRVNELPDFVEASDLAEMVKQKSKTNQIEVETKDQIAMIKFGEEGWPRPIQMCLWLGSYAQRYRCGDWMVIKQNKRDKKGRLIETWKADSRLTSSAVKKGPREGLVLKLSEREEAACLQRPEYLFCLSFSDYISEMSVIIEDSSVCKVAIETEASKERLHMAVCCDILERRNRLFASQVTLLPPIPLLPHILTLLFTKSVTYLRHKNRYGGFKVGDSEFKFTHTFSGKDVNDINETRCEISEALMQGGSLDVRDVGKIRDKVLDLIQRERVAYIDEEWEDLVREEVPEECLFLHKKDFNKDLEIYLRPIPRLEGIYDDVRYWTPEGLAQIEFQRKKIIQKKQDLVASINNKAKATKISEPRLVCSECQNVICVYRNARPQEISPSHGIFWLTGIFGSVFHISELNEEQENSEFVQNFPYDASELETWGVCVEGHLIGWKYEGKFLVDERSPLKLLTPDPKELDWSPELWANGIEDFYQFCEDTKSNQIEIDLKCDICKVEFSTRKEFYNHVIISNEHAAKVSKFLKEGF